MTMAENVRKALRIAINYGTVDGSHHKAWVIDQMVRELLGEDEYRRFRLVVGDWDEGITP
jgi:hypothetical protein